MCGFVRDSPQLSAEKLPVYCLLGVGDPRPDDRKIVGGHFAPDNMKPFQHCGNHGCPTTLGNGSNTVPPGGVTNRHR